MIRKTLYQTIALGGTFDHLHEGHKEFVRFAAEIAPNLIIGVTDQHMTLHKRFAQTIQPTHVRKQALLNFCTKNGITAKIQTIHDPYGPTLEHNSIQALVCTSATVKGADQINEIRLKLRLQELPVHIHKLKLDSQGNFPISAERIRAGEIDRTGQVYASFLETDRTLSPAARDFFSQIHGEVVSQPHQTDLPIIVVGDTTLETFIKNDWNYDLGIFDFKKRRKTAVSLLLKNLTSCEMVVNQPGKLTAQASKKLKIWMQKPQFRHLQVEGEEDLLAVGAVLLAPLGSTVYYGQPDVGMVACTVTEDIKETFLDKIQS